LPLFELWETDSFKKDLKRLDKKSAEHLRGLLPKLLENPARFKPLRGFSNHFRLRFESYRLVYKTEGNKVVLLFVKKRDSAYRSC